MKRFFTKELEAWKYGGMKKPLIVLGARQVGKSYIVTSFCKENFNNFKIINLFQDSTLAEIYNKNISSESKLSELRVYLNMNFDNNSILFVDEVQESESFISDLKFIQENHPEVNLICAGSLLGVKIKRLQKSFPVGKVQIKHLYPFTFDEFLVNIDKENYLELIENCFRENSKMTESIHEELVSLYRLFTYLGGMPEYLDSFINNNELIQGLDETFFDDLIASYVDDMSKYVSGNPESIKIHNSYNSIPAQQKNESHKFQYSKIKSGARASSYNTSIEWLLSANLIYKVNCVTNIEQPLKYFVDENTFKLFINDCGILTKMLNINAKDLILDKLKTAKGYIAENYVNGELTAKKVNLFYWRNESFSEIDFIIETNDGILPIEVKSGDNVKAKSLKVFQDRFKPKYSIRVSSKNFGFENNIKSVPLYAVSCISSVI
jgi:predicted AAA+ superfamily ATPase